MKITAAALLVLAATCVSAISSSPDATNKSLDTNSLNDFVDVSPLLSKRTFVCPCQSNNNLIDALMGNLKADLNARVFAPVSVSVSIIEKKL